MGIMAGLMVIVVIAVGMMITYALAVPLKRYLDREAERMRQAIPPADATMVEPLVGDEPGLTTEMANEWIRECRNDDV